MRFLKKFNESFIIDNIKGDFIKDKNDIENIFNLLYDEELHVGWFTEVRRNKSLMWIQVYPLKRERRDFHSFCDFVQNAIDRFSALGYTILVKVSLYDDNLSVQTSNDKFYSDARPCTVYRDMNIRNIQLEIEPD